MTHLTADEQFISAASAKARRVFLNRLRSDQSVALGVLANDQLCPDLAR